MKNKTILILSAALFLSGCTNSEKAWVKKCEDIKNVQKTVAATYPGMDLLNKVSGGSIDKQTEAFGQLDCKTFAEKENASCEKLVSDMSGNIKAAMYDQCMQGKYSMAVTESYMGKMGVRMPTATEKSDTVSGDASKENEK